MAEEDLFVILSQTPLFWLTIITVVTAYAVIKMTGNKLKPEQKPDFGVKYRAKRVDEHLKKRGKALAWKPDVRAILFNGIRPIGRIKQLEEIPQIVKQGKKINQQLFIWVIFYRRLGFMKWLLSLVGVGTQKIIVDKDSILSDYDSDKKQIEYVIDKDCYFRERGGMLILSRDPERIFIDEINADMDYENAKGFVSDFPRRLSNLHPAHAIHSDTLELESDIEEKHKTSFMSRFRKGG